MKYFLGQRVPFGEHFNHYLHVLNIYLFQTW